MRYLLTAICLVLTVLLTSSAGADDDTTRDGNRAGRRGEMRQKMLNEFDADGDGELSDDERANAREAMRARRGGKGKAGKGKAGKGKGRGQRGGPGGPGGRPDPAKLFDKYDADGDGQLSRAEFMKLAKEVRPPRPPRGHGKRGGPRPDGPPREGRRNFDRDRPLQNPGDRPGPPPRPEGRRRFNDEEGFDAPRGPQGPGAQGPGARGPGSQGRRGPGSPDPEVVFDRFDEDGDDQLSREEFMRLADHMREMHQRHGHHRQGHHGQGHHRQGRSGHGPRRGPPGDGPPPRPDLESEYGPEMPEIDDDSV